MTQNSQTPDARIMWPPHHSPRTAIVFTKNVIEISASAEVVWLLLIDCVMWPTWYRHCTNVSILSGGPLLGFGSKFRFKTLGFYGEPEITAFQPEQMLVWSAIGPAGLGGSHAWLIESTSGGCRVITEEVQTGRLLLVLRLYLRRKLLAMHQDWLRALKELAESMK